MPRAPIAATVEHIDVPMDLDAEKSASLKGSVIFRAPEPAEGEERPAVSNAYVRKDAWAAMGSPDRIALSIARPSVE